MHILYLKTVESKIQDKNFYKINLLDLDKCVVIKIYKPCNDTTKNKFIHFKQFQDISEFVTFDIRSDGKVTLDIK